MNRDVRKFIMSMVIFSVSFVTIDIVAGQVLDIVFFNIPGSNSVCAKVNHRYQGKDDVVLMGSSRCLYHFVTNQLSDSIHSYFDSSISVYNYGLNGLFLNSNLCAIESMLHRYSPKIIFLEAESHNFDDNETYDMGVMTAAPYYQRDSIVRKYIDGLGISKRIAMRLNMYRFSGAISLRMAKSLLKNTDVDNGYQPLYKTMDLKEPNRQAKESLYCKYSVDNFQRVAKLCKEKGVPLIVVSSPRYKPNRSTDYIRTLCTENNVGYIDLNNIELFNNHPEWFADRPHLNDEGAHIFTSLFFEQIKPYLDAVYNNDVR